MKLNREENSINQQVAEKIIKICLSPILCKATKFSATACTSLDVTLVFHHGAKKLQLPCNCSIFLQYQ
jgi:hypothetical protein